MEIWLNVWKSIKHSFSIVKLKLPNWCHKHKLSFFSSDAGPQHHAGHCHVLPGRLHCGGPPLLRQVPAELGSGSGREIPLNSTDPKASTAYMQHDVANHKNIPLKGRAWWIKWINIKCSDVRLFFLVESSTAPHLTARTWYIKKKIKKKLFWHKCNIILLE